MAKAFKPRPEHLARIEKLQGALDEARTNVDRLKRDLTALEAGEGRAQAGAIDGHLGRLQEHVERTTATRAALSGWEYKLGQSTEAMRVERERQESAEFKAALERLDVCEGRKDILFAEFKRIAIALGKVTGELMGVMNDGERLAVQLDLPSSSWSWARTSPLAAFLRHAVIVRWKLRGADLPAGHQTRVEVDALLEAQ